MNRIRTCLRGFRRATAANVAMMFALSLLPLAMAAGAGLDFANAMMTRNDMADALDSAALAVGAQNKLSESDARALAQKVFDANYKGSGSPTVTPQINGQQVSVTAEDSVATTLLNLFGKPSIDVSVSSVVVWGQTRLWVSLVLDNTGSMSQTDSTGTDKMTALKNASHSLLGILENAAANPGDVKVAIAPFAKDVNVGTSEADADWLDWADWEAPPPGGAPSSSVGPDSSCPWNSYGCLSGPGSANTTRNVPSSGSYAGYICPGPVRSSNAGLAGHYYNGCYDSEGTRSTTTETVSSGRHASCSGYSDCSCSGSGRNTVCKATVTSTGAPYVHKWIANDHDLWDGCVMDRDQDDDTTAETPGTKFPAENSQSCPPATVSTLSYDWSALNDKIDDMAPNGGTNQTIGLAHGMQLQTEGAPYDAPPLPDNTTRYIILLSDGLNTMDRWYGDGSSQSSSVDNRTSAACDYAKDQGFVIYTVFVDLNGTQGNSRVLQNCASDPGKYFDLTTSNAIVSTFQTIGQQITSLRIAS